MTLKLFLKTWLFHFRPGSQPCTQVISIASQFVATAEFPMGMGSQDPTGWPNGLDVFGGFNDLRPKIWVINSGDHHVSSCIIIYPYLEGFLCGFSLFAQKAARPWMDMAPKVLQKGLSLQLVVVLLVLWLDLEATSWWDWKRYLKRNAGCSQNYKYGHNLYHTASLHGAACHVGVSVAEPWEQAHVCFSSCIDLKKMWEWIKTPLYPGFTSKLLFMDLHPWENPTFWATAARLSTKCGPVEASQQLPVLQCSSFVVDPPNWRSNKYQNQIPSGKLT